MPSAVSIWFPLIIQIAPQVAPQTMAAVIQAESGGNPLAIHDNVSGESFAPATKRDAVALARRLMAAHRSFDAGLTQINSANFEKLGVTVESVFDPASAIKAAETLMVADYRICLKVVPAAALRCMASRYNTGDSEKGIGNGYVARLWKAAAQIVPAIGGALPPPANQPESDPSDPEPVPYDVWAHQEWADRQPSRRTLPVEPPTLPLTPKENPVPNTETFEARAKKIFMLALVLASALALPAFAQAVGGGGDAGWLRGLWQTFLQNIAPGLGIAAIAVVGILAMGARLGLIIVCGIVIGIYIVNHADQIYGLIAVG